jgi:predicted TIM-barrel fold metal-dependent hydrolase
VSAQVSVVDAAVHVMPATKEDFLEFLPEAWQNRIFPGPERYHYALGTGEYWPPSVTERGLPASDPALVATHLFDELHADFAVLLPLTRGLHPNSNLATALCAATNDWLAARFLHADARFRGTIRVDPRSPEAAVDEIERWADNPLMVQVGVSTQALEPYGHERYLPVWRAAAAHDLPVVIHADGGAGADFPPTPAGYPRTAIEYNCLLPLNHGFHLASLIAEGTFEWVDDLVFIFADGGFDALWPIVWRLDKDWRGNRDEVPAVRRAPSEYLREHVRFVAHRLEGPVDRVGRREWLEASESAADMLLFASNYPNWDLWRAGDALDDLPEAFRDRVLYSNAAALYGLPQN